MSPGIQRTILAVLCVYILLFFGLTDAGLMGPDEPRYASVGREMARSGDWITPRLWGEPWFEKPPLLYWMVGLGFRFGLGDDLAPRLPVAIASLMFLVFYQRWLRREFGDREAWFAAGILATSAGWLGFSQLAVTDLPLAAAFSASMLLSLPWIKHQDKRWVIPAGALLGVAVLAKGLVPLALALPLVWMGRRQMGGLVSCLGAMLAVAVPWYASCTARNGMVFLEDFFWKHHFQRYASDVIQHVQPFWYYGPVLLAGLFPWTPLLLLLWRRDFLRDERLKFLLLVVVFGLVFLSASTNKLPGYLLPLLPPLSAVLGVVLARSGEAHWALGASALLLAVLPTAGAVLPRALQVGLSRAEFPAFQWLALAPVLTLTVLVVWQKHAGRRDFSVALLVAGIVAGVFLLKLWTLPKLDEMVSSRTLWREVASRAGQVCVEGLHRSWRYGLNYYSIDPLPECTQSQRPLQIRQRPGAPPHLARREPAR